MVDTPVARGRRPRVRWRPWLRALHRDCGYLAVGLTFVYALSGLAVNHIADWDSNFVDTRETFAVATRLPADPERAASIVLAQAGVEDPAEDIYSPAPGELEITARNHTLIVDTVAGQVRHDVRRERIFFRVANWLHLNRGKRAWTLFADGYAVGLLFLALSGVFMLPGKKGLIGRGAVFIAMGVSLPIGYLVYFGGP